MTKMKKWDVYLGDELVDIVFYDADCDTKYVRRGLVEHNGYNPNIIVK